jgi:fatty acid desaturase
MAETMIESPLSRLSDEEIEQLGKEFDAIHDEVFAELGDRDRRYIVSMIEMHRRLVVTGRILLFGSRNRAAWVAGTSMLALAKILENMEIGHNVMHGQWDWMNDPQINSATWDWDTASTAEAWKHSHNYIHHTYTNIRGKDRDLGYEIMRIDPHQKWHPVYLLQPFYNLLLAAFFEWGVALHDLDFEAIKRGEKSKAAISRELKGIGQKAWAQVAKDYLTFPALTAAINTGVTAGVRALQGRTKSRRRRAYERVRPPQQQSLVDVARESYAVTLKANFTANIVRNVWSYAIIFCGHFPDQTYTFSQEETDNETRGGFYARQLLGAANIDGRPLFHVISGNLGYQVEHHLYPDMPSTRYAEIAPRVKDICARYGLPYNTGPFSKQLGGVQRTILRLAFPGGAPRPKPGPYQEPAADDAGLRSDREQRFARPGENGSGPEQPTDGVRVSMPQEE